MSNDAAALEQRNNNSLFVFGIQIHLCFYLFFYTVGLKCCRHIWVFPPLLTPTSLLRS